ncbi:MAG TPA: CopG family transcriptional regulator [Candidatus Angelobacter sp.]|jgi:hypothetical protein|nr:CopG family transcriptional regulator [Candidatus Angelobacter sp.]
MAAHPRARTYTTTVRLPGAVYEEAKCVLDKEKGEGPVGSMNDLIVLAMTAYLKMYKRRQIDAMFAHIAEDADYQKEASLLAEEFAESDWEALQAAENDLTAELSTNVSNSSR